MEAIQAKSGVPVDQQRLIFMGAQLQEDSLLSDYGIADGSRIHCVLKLTGC
jgi:hypothetical protein